jgi:hypothetical protein
MEAVDFVARGDRRVMELMVEGGGDLSSATEVNHYLYFPAKESAERAGKRLSERGFGVEVGPPLKGYRDWCLFATHTAVVSESSIGLLRAAMERIAAEFGGKYDGWEALTVPEGSGE